MQYLELLAPARNLETGMAAVDHGADAVYIGAQRFGARAAAGNSTEDIATLCRYAHSFGVKVYVTVNTIVYEHELDDTLQLLCQLIRARVDAILVQDMAVPELLHRAFDLVRHEEQSGTPYRMPQLHASTQTDNRTAEKVAWLYRHGFTRVVLARELSLQEIRAIHEAVPQVQLEVFVHGALCVSYSGACYASQFCQQRSANRGECAQMCRMRYTLTDADGSVIERQLYLLSLKDMCRLSYLEELAEAGACSFKIEGRLKDVPYVKNITAAYRQELDSIIARHPDHYARASWGQCSYTFQPDVERSFNRGFTTYFLHGREKDICNPYTPKAMGQTVGIVRQLQRQWFSVSAPTTTVFTNGDGLCFLNDHQQLVGFRVNRAEGLRLFPQRMPEGLRVGTKLYRNMDAAFDKLLAGKTGERKIALAMHLEDIPEGFRLSAQAVDAPLCASIDCLSEHQLADKPQHENIRRQLTRLGGTPYRCEQLALPSAFPYFIPSSLLADLRRQLVTALISSSQSVLTEDVRPAFIETGSPISSASSSVPYASSAPLSASCLPMNASSTVPYVSMSSQLCYTLNIANSLARRFYEEQGGAGDSPLAPAFELQQPPGSKLLMQCRHCIRFMLGRCVRHGVRQPEWREPLFLSLDNGQRFRLQFDCRHCQMNILSDK